MDQVYAVLAGQTRPEKEELGTAPGEVGITRHLPEVEISDLAGLLENLAEGGNQKHDIYLLEDKLGITSDQLLKLTEAAELLGFSSIAKGDIELTALGQTFADASILASKEIFASCVRRIPLMRWLLHMLHSAEDRRLKIEVILTALSLDFSTEEAEKQIEVLIKWGRYGELFVYDDDQEMIELEEGR